MLKMNAVYCGGESGQFRANGDSIGWRADAGGRILVQAASAVKKAEWFEGKLRMLCDSGEGEGEEIVAFDGFLPEHFDPLWRYFERNCGVYVKKHKASAAIEEDDFDAAMRAVEASADLVDELPLRSVMRKAREADLMKQVECLRDGLARAVAGDKQALSRVFSANGCERIGRLRLVVDTVQLEVYQQDPRWLHLRNMASTIERVLRELGNFCAWLPSAEECGPEGVETSSSMTRRMMVWELQQKQGGPDSLSMPLSETVDTPSVSPMSGGGNQDQPRRLAPEALAVVEAALAQAAPPAPTPTPSTVERSPLGTRGDPLLQGRGYGMAYPPKPILDTDEDVSDPSNNRADALDGHLVGLGGDSEATRRARYMRSDSILEGWVWKRSRFIGRWRRRWLILTPNFLATYKQRGDRVPTEQVDKGTVHRIIDADTQLGQSRSFVIVQGKRTYFMVCDTDALKREWIREVSNALIRK